MLTLLGCGPAGTVVPDAGPKHQASAALRACAAFATSEVSSTGLMIERLNALPRPVTVPCFVASLPRPLSLVATDSVTSAQPADGPSSPRIFIMGPAMVVSVVATGHGATLLETGEWVTNRRTIKGEVELPFEGTLAPDAPFTRVAQSNQSTSCALCHRAETPHDTLAGVYVSDAFRPNPGEEVPATELQRLHDACVAADGGEPPHCELFHALFDFGSVRQGMFRREVSLFFE